MRNIQGKLFLIKNEIIFTHILEKRKRTIFVTLFGPTIRFIVLKNLQYLEDWQPDFLHLTKDICEAYGFSGFGTFGRCHDNERHLSEFITPIEKYLLILTSENQFLYISHYEFERALNIGDIYMHE